MVMSTLSFGFGQVPDSNDSRDIDSVHREDSGSHAQRVAKRRVVVKLISFFLRFSVNPHCALPFNKHKGNVVKAGYIPLEANRCRK